MLISCSSIAEPSCSELDRWRKLDSHGECVEFALLARTATSQTLKMEASSSSGSTDASSSKVSRQGSNKITYKISLMAQEYCADLIKDFNLCAKGRSVSMMWACRDKYHKSQDCVHML